MGDCTPSTKSSLLFSLRTHVLPEVKVLARKLTFPSDIACAEVTERTIAIAPSVMEKLLVKLCRFPIEAAHLAREIAPGRTREIAAYNFTCMNAAVETLYWGQNSPAEHRQHRKAGLKPLGPRSSAGMAHPLSLHCHPLRLVRRHPRIFRDPRLRPHLPQSNQKTLSGSLIPRGIPRAWPRAGAPLTASDPTKRS